MLLLRQLAIPALMLAGLAALIVAIAMWRGGPANDAAVGDWTCSMHPQIRQPRPGNCPICGMALVPVTQLAKEQAQLENRAGIFVERVIHRELHKQIRTVGKLDYNERQTAFITARINGRVDRVYADFTGIQVKKNDHLVDIYSPDLFVGQSELIRGVEAMAAAKQGGQATGTFAETTVEAARTKLRLLGLLPEQIQEIEKSKKIRTHLTIYTTIGGTVIEKNIREGQYVKEGDVLYRVANLDPLWLYLDIYESELGWVRVGQTVKVTLESFPGEKFQGKVVFMDPALDEKTRTVRARVNLSNPDGKLKPGMYANAAIRVRLLSDGSPDPTGLEGKYLCPMHPEVVRDKQGKCDICEMPLEKVPARKPLIDHKHHHHDHTAPEKPERTAIGTPERSVLAIPASAVLDTGRRKVAYRLNNEKAYELVELALGPRAEEMDDKGNTISYFAVLGGLKHGDQVVVRGAFLLDSQRQIEGMPSLLYPHGQTAVNLHDGHGAPPPLKGKDVTTHKH